MHETNLNSISANWKDLYQKGCHALDQGDVNSAIVLFNQTLDGEPGFVDCREMLRKAQWLRARNTRGFLKHVFEEVREFPELAEAETCSRTKPLQAIRAAEQVLNHVPNNLLAHKILAQAALKADVPRTAMLSLNFLLAHAPTRMDVALELADALALEGKTSEAMSIYGRLLKDYSGNKRVTRAMSRLYKRVHDSQPDGKLASRMPHIPSRTTLRSLKTSPPRPGMARQSSSRSRYGY